MGKLKDLDINDIKLMLKFEFIGENKVKLSLIAAKDKYLFDPKHNTGWNFYKDDKTNFSIWSADDFLFNKSQLRLPNLKNSKGIISSTCRFQSDLIRKQSIKNMYKCLTKWSNKVSSGNNENSVVVDNEYWYVL